MPERSELMKDPEIDPILSWQEEILPSSGFAAFVMDAVRREAAAPPPIPFPWKRALPGLVAWGVVLALVVVAVVTAARYSGVSSAPQIAPPSAISTHDLGEKIQTAAVWTAWAILAAFVTVKLSMRLAVGKT